MDVRSLLRDVPVLDGNPPTLDRDDIPGEPEPHAATNAFAINAPATPPAGR